jgi:hypothetical protein
MLATEAKTSADELRHTLSNEPQHRTLDRKTFPFGAPRCGTCQPAASVMQSGRHTKRKWLLEFEPASPPWIEPLMGWTASDDPLASVRLNFATPSAAIDTSSGTVLTTRSSMPRRGGSHDLFPPRELRRPSTPCYAANPIRGSRS